MERARKLSSALNQHTNSKAHAESHIGDGVDTPIHRGVAQVHQVSHDGHQRGIHHACGQNKQECVISLPKAPASPSTPPPWSAVPMLSTNTGPGRNHTPSSVHLPASLHSCLSTSLFWWENGEEKSFQGLFCFVLFFTLRDYLPMAKPRPALGPMRP